jgi:pimeloyl-ACP methyl ester carboxylesterase
MRCVLAVFAVLHALALTAAGAQQPTPGRRVAISADRSLWLSCAGTGQPVVVLEAGHTESSATWAQLQDRIATFTRVCSYDRAGRGRSDPAPTAPRRGNDIVRDLQALLHRAPEPGSYLLVGHSLGGAFARLYAASHANEVTGIVLVDAVHEREFAAIDELLTPEQRAAGAGMRPLSPEGIDVEKVFEELAASTRPLSMPVIVIARGRPLAVDEMPPTWSADQRRRREELRKALQADLATVSPSGELLIAQRSGHLVHHDEPEVVAEAIHRLVERWRKGHGGR